MRDCNFTPDTYGFGDANRQLKGLQVYGVATTPYQQLDIYVRSNEPQKMPGDLLVDATNTIVKLLRSIYNLLPSWATGELYMDLHKSPQNPFALK
jgi:hypothetical protein